ncbi:hypothetical protein E2C01_029872 [Portunus trituberculatus]|uniref:Uncharacterized protein n=1 Tax=Portunus trituberculatus TaxID=210409 RepID=A0A5B7ESL2_PORTR|nr:hypothetical protein [Portunus trituberculatus]
MVSFIFLPFTPSTISLSRYGFPPLSLQPPPTFKANHPHTKRTTSPVQLKHFYNFPLGSLHHQWLIQLPLCYFSKNPKDSRDPLNSNHYHSTSTNTKTSFYTAHSISSDTPFTVPSYKTTRK